MDEPKKTYIEWVLKNYRPIQLKMVSNLFLVNKVDRLMTEQESLEEAEKEQLEVDGYKPFVILRAVKIIQKHKTKYPEVCQQLCDSLIEATKFKFEPGEFRHNLSEYFDQNFWMKQFAIPLLHLWKLASPEFRTEERKRDLSDLVEKCENLDRTGIESIHAKQKPGLDLEEEMVKFIRDFKERQSKIQKDNNDMKELGMVRDSEAFVLFMQVKRLSEDL
tara:strand:- start:69030 stop:69686 length:657 start_codon:yes stop_codon:yes gene_type:complete